MAQQQITAPSSYPAPVSDDASTQELAVYIHQAMVAVEEQQDNLGVVPAGHRVRSASGLMHRSGHGAEHDRRVLFELHKKYADFFAGLSADKRRLFVTQDAGAGTAAPPPPRTPEVPPRQYLPAADYFRTLTASAQRRAARSPQQVAPRSQVRDDSVIWDVDAQGYAVPRQAPSQALPPQMSPRSPLPTMEQQNPVNTGTPVCQELRREPATPAPQQGQPPIPTVFQQAEVQHSPVARSAAPAPAVDVTKLFEMMINAHREESTSLRQEVQAKLDRSQPKDPMLAWQGRARPPPPLDELPYEAWRERFGTWERVHVGMPGSLKGALL
eukprot:gene41522-52626_t